MKQSFTLNQCLRMLYGETTPGEEHMLHDLISSNAELCAEFNAMKEGYDFLNTLDAAPSDESVSNVITFLRQQPVRLGI